MNNNGIPILLFIIFFLNSCSNEETVTAPKTNHIAFYHRSGTAHIFKMDYETISITH